MNTKHSLNRTQIKYIAITAMLMDHTAAFLLQPEKYPALIVIYILMRTLGRIAAPVMFYFLTEGYRYTSSKFKYGLRLFCFGILSQIPYSLARYGDISLQRRIRKENHRQQVGILPVLSIAFPSILAHFKSLKKFDKRGYILYT